MWARTSCTDHAGVATQTKVESYLRREKHTCARELGRDKFIEVAKQWRDKHGGIIIEQLKKLGASCDWSRLVHTLDDDYSRGDSEDPYVRRVFGESLEVLDEHFGALALRVFAPLRDSLQEGRA